ncbi:MAG: hypothetical protein ACYS8Z_08230 [Planctomycetota bacterium]|jgi:hypothetical protein
MIEKTKKSKGWRLSILGFCVLAVIGGSFCRGEASAEKAESPQNSPDLWDPAKYIDLDEIKPGMEGYCLTEYGVKGIEKFGLEVVDVVRDFEPGRDVILVKGTDERFIHTGPVAGCSGSPVYINGRMAGALAYAWTYSKDPLYGATAIRDMLQIGLGKSENPEPTLVFDYSKPIDLEEIDRQITSSLASSRRHSAGISTLPCPLITSGFSAEAREHLDAALKPFGFMVVPGIAGSSAAGSGGEEGSEELQLSPGSCLAVPLVSGDMTMAVYGTVTEVRDGSVYGFGHPFQGFGPVDLPMAVGKVHTVIATISRSSKLAAVVKTVGALRSDEGSGILGKIGEEARTFPLTVRIDRYNDTERVYNCKVASSRMLTPSSIRSIIAGAALYLGDLPPDHTIQYKGKLGIKGFEPITWENVSTGFGVLQMASESAAAVALLMNNPYGKVEFDSMEFDVRIVPKDAISQIWSVKASDTTVKAGERIGIDLVIEAVHTKKKAYHIDMDVPENLKPGKYELTLCGSRDYEQFLLKTVPYKFVGRDLPDLVGALRDTLQVKREGVYCYLVLPSAGIVIEKAELPDLPPTKMLVLQSLARPISAQLYPHWIEKTLPTGTVVLNKKIIRITVEK